MIDVTSNSGWLSCTLRIIHVIQMIVQGQWLNQSELLTVPHVNKSSLSCIRNLIGRHLGCSTPTLFGIRMMHSKKKSLTDNLLMEVLPKKSAVEVRNFFCDIPLIHITVKVTNQDTENKTVITFTPYETYTFEADANLDFEIDLHRTGGDNGAVQSKKFPKQKDESWMVLLGMPDEDDLVAMKRVTLKRTASVTFKVKVPYRKGIILFR